MSQLVLLPVIGNELAEEIDDELATAISKHNPMNSAHEAYAVILEELDEFWDEVRAQTGTRDRAAMHHELVQTAAMAIRAIKDLNL